MNEQTENFPNALPANAVRIRKSSRKSSQIRGSGFLLLAVRLIFVALLVVVITVTVASSRNVQDFGPSTVIGLIIAAVGVGMVVLLLDLLTPNKRLTSVAGVYFGICLGLVAAVAFGALIDTVARAWEILDGPAQLYLSLTKIILGIVFCYLSVSIVLTTKDDFRLIIPYVEFNKQPSGIAPILLDSSTLIDGRIEALANGQILDAPLVVPKFVLEEMQKLCDSNDRQKRARGRRGLDLVAHMQVNTKIDLRIEDIGLDGRGVDRMLVELAMKEHMRIATGDTGLQRVATISGIVTININEIAAALQPPMFLGESIGVDITRVGEQDGQGIGHLPDGTMVVIDGGAEKMGSHANGTVSNILQTAGGRIIFAKIDPPLSGSTESMTAKAVGQPREIQSGGNPQTTTDQTRRSNPPSARNPRRT
ncbi:MAG: PIN/TRAM domain-containing protein [Phycisphaerales bacterium]